MAARSSCAARSPASTSHRRLALVAGARVPPVSLLPVPRLLASALAVERKTAHVEYTYNIFLLYEYNFPGNALSVDYLVISKVTENSVSTIEFYLLFLTKSNGLC